MNSHRPRKRFGQNFLRDQHVLDRIMAAAGIVPGEQVMEIGPGQGALTDRLLNAGAELQVIEIDRDLAASLQERQEPNLTVVLKDVLKLDWSQVLTEPPYKLVANLPYNISSQVLFKALEHRDSFSRLILMFQKEVGDRLVAGPSTRDYGILSVLVQTWFAVSRVIKVPPRAFFPPPKVDSVVLKLEPLPEPRAFIADENLYRQLVRGAFAQRRKTLRNSLIGSGCLADQVDRACAQIDLDPGRRGETLSIEEFASLANEMQKLAEGDMDD